MFENYLIKNILYNDKNFSDIAGAFTEEILNNFDITHHKRNEIVIEANTKINKTVYVIIHGDLCEENNSKKRLKHLIGEVVLSDYVYFNEEKIIEKTLKAVPECLIAKIELNQLMKLLEEPFEKVKENLIKLEFCKKSKVFKHLSQFYLNRLCHYLTLETFNNEYIFKVGDEANKLYLIKSGIVELLYTINNVVHSVRIEPAEYFGKNALLYYVGNKSSDVTPRRTGAAFAVDKVECYTIERNNFIQIFKNNLFLKDYTMTRFHYLDPHLTLTDFYIFNQVSDGPRGPGLLSRNKLNNCLYFIKIFDKRIFENEQNFKNIKMTKQVLLKLDHPFIVKLSRTMKDNNYIYFLIEYLRGKDLTTILKEEQKIDPEIAKFWGASILIALKHIHKKKIIYRDLKPENVIILKSGYIKLIEFDVATIIPTEGKTYSVKGTPHYMAPEMIYQYSGYSFYVDFWALGVLLFQLVCGYLPFGHLLSDPNEIYMSIVNE